MHMCISKANVKPTMGHFLLRRGGRLPLFQRLCLMGEGGLPLFQGRVDCLCFKGEWSASLSDGGGWSASVSGERVVCVSV